MSDCFTLLYSTKKKKEKKKKSPPIPTFQRVLVKLLGSLAGEAFERTDSNEWGRASKKSLWSRFEKGTTCYYTKKTGGEISAARSCCGNPAASGERGGCARGPRALPGGPGRASPRTLGTLCSPTAMSQEVPPHSAPRFYKWGVSLRLEGVCVVPKCRRGPGCREHPHPPRLHLHHKPSLPPHPHLHPGSACHPTCCENGAFALWSPRPEAQGAEMLEGTCSPLSFQ